MVVHVNVCRRFQANMFSKTRCQNCFKPKDGHTGEALELAKVSNFAESLEALRLFFCIYCLIASNMCKFIDKSALVLLRFPLNKHYRSVMGFFFF